MSKKNMVKMFNQFSIKHRLTDVFYDFVHVAAIAISNAIDFKNFKNREKQYFEVMKKYSHEEQVLLSDIFGELTRTIEEEPGDVLGELYMELGLGNSGTGQFFTPYHVSVLASKVTFDKDK
ncbi:MAG: N-6 DNA methylase, partial [Clostridium sp.]